VLRVRHAGTVALLALGLAYVSIPQGGGWNANAHFSTVRSIAKGHAYIDEFRSETGDVAWYHGHYYAAKAPGLALLMVGPYILLRSGGVFSLVAHLPAYLNYRRGFGESAPIVGITPPMATSAVGELWLLTIVGCALPILVALLFLRRIGEELAPGFGTAGALSVGLGTLLLPFATLFFDHAVSASLGFVAFSVLWWRRDRLLYCALAGVAAGYAVSCEYPLVLVAAALALYVLLTAPHQRRLERTSAYAVGAALGMLPIVVFNWWAFGSPLHNTYQDSVSAEGTTGHDVLQANAHGLFGVGWPHVDTGAELLFSHIGLLTLSPILAVGAAGIGLLYRAAWRAEAFLVGGLSLAFLIYNSGYVWAFGGWTPGPRFLIPIVPFLAIPLALAYRSWPLTTASLTLASVATMSLVTATVPLAAHDGRWYHRAVVGYFYGQGVAAIVPFAIFVLVASVFGALATDVPRMGRADVVGAAAAVSGWLLLALAAPRMLGRQPTVYVVLLAFCTVAAVLVAHCFAGLRLDRRAKTV
jgi:hypothetical protein